MSGTVVILRETLEKLIDRDDRPWGVPIYRGDVEYKMRNYITDEVCTYCGGVVTPAAYGTHGEPDGCQHKETCPIREIQRLIWPEDFEEPE